MTPSKWITVFGLLVLALVLAAPAQQKADDKVVDPVCGMTVLKSQAKATFEYQGETYYFCSTGCKDRFAKEPEKYLAKMKVAKAGAPAEKGEVMPMAQAGMGMRHGQTPEPSAGTPMMHGQRMMAHRMPMGMMMRHGRGMMMAGTMMCGCGSTGCPMMAEGVEHKIEKTADGVVIKVTAKDPELVKKIQAHFDQMAAQKAPQASSAGTCPPDCPMKKAETATEVKK
jgi:YHS domain-containing protein/TusA-related sulfurtransferase